MPEALGDVMALLRTRQYLALLGVAAFVGAPIAAVAYWYLYLVDDLQKWAFDPAYLPKALGFHGEPAWWPIPMVTLAGLLVGSTIRYLPGRGGRPPADGFHAEGVTPPVELVGVFLASVAGLSLGAVIGPEAPLIAIGGGLAAGLVQLSKRDTPPRSIQVVGAAGGFSAISTLLGSPLSGAFLLMEASGLGGPTLGLILVPGLLAAGTGSLIFVGFDSWTGHGVVSLTVPDLPALSRPTGAEFGWAIGIGIAAAVIGGSIRRLALFLEPHVEGRIASLAPVVGLAVGALAVLFAEGTGKASSLVLFSGQSALPSFLQGAGSYSAGVLLLLLVCKSLAYGASLSAFRGGPTFPGMFLGAVGGVALSKLPGLPMVAGAAMGVAAMTCAVLGLPLTSVLLTTIFFGSDGVTAMPVVIVAVVVTYVTCAHLPPRRTSTQQRRVDTAGTPLRPEARPSSTSAAHGLHRAGTGLN